MINTLLGNAFLDILKNEWLGILASAFVLISFLTSNQIRTRIINLVGCVVFVIYGLILPAYSTAFMNAALIVVHIVYLVKDFKARKKNKETVVVNIEQNATQQVNISNEEKGDTANKAE